MNVFVVRTNYNGLLREIKKFEKVDKGFQKKLTEIVTTLKVVSNGLKQISREYYFEQDETEIWDHYQQIQKERLSLLNILHEWKIVWIPTLRMRAEFIHIIPRIQNAINELTDYVTAFGDTLRSHVDILEIQNSRGNRKIIRKLTYMTLLVTVVFPYVTLWQNLARGYILTLQFPWGLSPQLNLVVLIITLVPLVVALIQGWRYIMREDNHTSKSQKTQTDTTEKKANRLNVLLVALGVLLGVIGNFFVEFCFALSPPSVEIALIGYALSLGALLAILSVLVYLVVRKTKS